MRSYSAYLMQSAPKITRKRRRENLRPAVDFVGSNDHAMQKGECGIRRGGERNELANRTTTENWYEQGEVPDA